jgi:hypothetical protein
VHELRPMGVAKALLPTNAPVTEHEMLGRG